MRRSNTGLDLSKLTYKQQQEIAKNTALFSKLSSGAQRPDQEKEIKEGVGFTYHHVAHPLGRMFQNAKNIAIEKTLDQVWKVMIRYMCKGDKEKYRLALKDPSIAFNFGNTYTGHIHSLMYKMIESEFTDNDSARKQLRMKQMADIGCTIIFEDIYYRTHSKPCIEMLVDNYNKNPDIYKLTPEEQEIKDKWDNFAEKRATGQAYGNEK